MRVTCRHCNARAKITASKAETAELRTLYVQCEDCGARMVWQLAYSHDVVEPETDFAALASELLEKLSEEQRRQVLARWRLAPQSLIHVEGER